MEFSFSDINLEPLAVQLPACEAVPCVITFQNKLNRTLILFSNLSTSYRKIVQEQLLG